MMSWLRKPRINSLLPLSAHFSISDVGSCSHDVGPYVAEGYYCVCSNIAATNTVV